MMELPLLGNLLSVASQAAPGAAQPLEGAGDGFAAALAQTPLTQKPLAQAPLPQAPLAPAQTAPDADALMVGQPLPLFGFLPLTGKTLPEGLADAANGHLPDGGENANDPASDVPSLAPIVPVALPASLTPLPADAAALAEMVGVPALPNLPVQAEEAGRAQIKASHQGPIAALSNGLLADADAASQLTQQARQADFAVASLGMPTARPDAPARAEPAVSQAVPAAREPVAEGQSLALGAASGDAAGSSEPDTGTGQSGQRHSQSGAFASTVNHLALRDPAAAVLTQLPQPEANQPVMAGDRVAPALDLAPAAEIDLATVIDRLVEGRVQSRAERNELNLPHPDFGRVTLAFQLNNDNQLAMGMPDAPDELRQALTQAIGQSAAGGRMDRNDPGSSNSAASHSAGNANQTADAGAQGAMAEGRRHSDARNEAQPLINRRPDDEPGGDTQPRLQGRNSDAHQPGSANWRGVLA